MGRLGLRDRVHYLGTCQAIRLAWSSNSSGLGHICCGAVIDRTVARPERLIVGVRTDLKGAPTDWGAE